MAPNRHKLAGQHDQSEACHADSDPNEMLLNRLFGRLEEALKLIHAEIKRIADHSDPPAPDKVGTPYIAGRLGCTTVWVTEMVRSGEIPKACVVEGTGNGKVWKFHRKQIDHWIQSR